MPFSPKANRFFRAVAHGWKPSDPKLHGPSQTKAAELAAEGVKGGSDKSEHNRAVGRRIFGR